MRKVAAGILCGVFLCSSAVPANVYSGIGAQSRSLSSGFNGSNGSKSSIMFESEEELRNYGKKHIVQVFDKVLAEQEQLTGIAQYSKPSFDVVEITDPVNIDFNGGQYFPYDELILIYQGNNRRRGELLEDYKKKGFDESNHKFELENVLAHELGHHYLHLRARELGALWYLIRPGMNRSFGPKLIDEGVSEYLAHKTRPNKKYLSKADPDIFMDLKAWSPDMYRAAFELVRPILDKDCVKGIDYLLMNPIEDTSPEGLVRYSVTAMQALTVAK
jgi:hypothetical protein